MRSSIPLYDALAEDYDAHFAAPHRHAYDELSWQAVAERLDPGDERPVVDAGCGVGRWAQRLIAAGHRVVGIEQAPLMLDGARARGLGEGFELVEGSMERVELPPGAAAAVVAMGSLQYTDDPVATVERMAGWVAPGGTVAVLVDGLASLVIELARSGRLEEAERRRRTRRGVWSAGGHSADLHLFDAATLRAAFVRAGLVDIEVRGLLCGWTLLGPEAEVVRLREQPDVAMAQEAEWSLDPSMADLGTQLLALGRVPGT